MTVYAAFNREGIEFPYPQFTFTIYFLFLQTEFPIE